MTRTTPDRRTFLRCSLATAAASVVGTHASFGRSEPGDGPTKSKPDVVVYDGTYPGWPWITDDGEGTLYCVFREGTRHGYCPKGKAMITRSTDGGKTWAPATVIVDAPEVDDRNVAAVILPGGELLVTYNTYTADRKSAAMTVRSADGGGSWSEPRPIGHPNSRTRSAVVVLSDGSLLLPFYIAPGDAALAAVSKDNGASWETVRMANVDRFVGDEWSVLEVEPGRIVGIIRNNIRGSDGVFWKSESRDGGRTWSTAKPTNLQSLRHPSPAQIAWHAKTPIVIYADRRMVSVSAARTTDPDFLRWDVEHRVPCYRYRPDGQHIRDASYPVSVQTGPNERLIVDYEIRDTTARIAGYFVPFPEDWGA